MQFIVLPTRALPLGAGPRAAILVPDSWDDHHYRTSFDLWIRPADGSWPVEIGRVKIALLDQEPGPSPLPAGTHEGGLPRGVGDWVSLGQDDQYYEKIKDLGPAMCRQILTGLNDLALNLGVFATARWTDPVRISLLRSIAEHTVVGQFHRIATGGRRLAGYQFNYHPPQADPSVPARGPMEFEVTPESAPPTNIHVLIGRNGEGKTTLLRSLAKAAVRPEDGAGWIEHFPNGADEPPFANVVLVAFSAFDPFTDIRPSSPAIRYARIGLIAQQSDVGPDQNLVITKSDLAGEFVDSLRSVMAAGRYERWRKALVTLGSDRQFKAAVLDDCEVAIHRTGEEATVPYTGSGRLWREVFNNLSSGHAIVLLTLTRLVDLAAERTLILLDEPESHLHPPLLSSFVRALSNLLTDRNGVAVTATHSPVVLQEVPKSCVYKITRNGRHIRARRPRYETYGENVGVLTHEIFGLEVMRSGFYAEVERAVHEFGDYEEVINHFGGELGDEARGLVRILLADREGGER
ncbi:ATP-dependent endonuclease [Streptomyces sp. NPDC127112]|uniref:ATP-dependent nuclease n=1 Tax=Streptomyces sp. NPDC127112 TaxID=3345364 RepID=UPI00362E76B0